MAVETIYGTGARDPGSLQAQDAVYGGAVVRALMSGGRFFISGVTTDPGSRLIFGQIPSQAVIDFGSTLYFGAQPGGTDLDLGFLNRPNALGDALNLSAAGSIVLASVVPLDDFPKRAWELAGYARDPAGYLDVILTTNAVITGNQWIQLSLSYGKVG